MSRTPLGPVLVVLLSIAWLPATAGEPADTPAKRAARAVAAGTTIDTPPVLIYFGLPPKPYQPVRLTVRRPASETYLTAAHVQGAKLVAVTTTPSSQGVEIDLLVEPVEKRTTAVVDVHVNGRTLGRREVTLQPVRKFVFYLLPHSHHDIGYTHLQTEVEKKQWGNIGSALHLCEKTADWPPEARFKWNTEVMWAMDSWLRKEYSDGGGYRFERLDRGGQFDVYERTDGRGQFDVFEQALRRGQLDLDALYGNELTGLCRPEELMRLCERSQEWARRLNVKVDTAMISDVPGYTWGIVPVLAQAGVKYFSIGPNECDRLGRTNTAWADKPFYWIAPDRRHKVLCWVPYGGYSLGHHKRKVTDIVMERVAALERANYPYDIVYFRWNVGGDNGAPDATLSDVVRDWNARYAYPKLIIATGSEMFQEFEKRYGDKVPSFYGDFTPYWEDGAGSSARETSINRTAAERLVQAETLWAIAASQPYPAEKFSDAWRNVVLYDEHTWGAYNSVDEPDAPLVKDQWKIKQAFALDGDAQSKDLLERPFLTPPGVEPIVGGVDVYNTSSWPRTDLVVLSKDQSVLGDVVKGPDGKPVPSQRLSTGELAFLAQDIPPLAGRRFSLHGGQPAAKGRAKAAGTTLSNAAVSLRVDPVSGTIVSLRSPKLGAELCDMSKGVGLNQYNYVLGKLIDEKKEYFQAGRTKVAVKEAGPLVASLLIESEAPGCNKLSREVRVVDGLDRVDMTNVVDKQPVRRKEAVHLGYAFNVPGGTMRMDIPWAVVRPEVDQLPGANRNYFSVGRWLDVSNDRYGVTWATLDAPCVEVGAMTIYDIGPQNGPEAWLAHIRPSQTFYSYVMNNHWFTNYKADQEGPTTFRYALLPHGQYDPVAAQRFGIERSQPLVVVEPAGDRDPPSEQPLLVLDTPDVIVASIKPAALAEAVPAWIIRLFAAAGRPANVHLVWGQRQPARVWLSNLAEDRVKPLDSPLGPVNMAGWELVTLRAEMQ
jgi:hypothetical protein